MVRKNLISNYIGQAWTIVMSFAFIPIYIKYLGMEAYGLIGIFVLLTNWLLLLDLGMAPTLSREMANFTAGVRTKESVRDLLRSVEIVMISIGVLVFILIVILSDWITINWVQAKYLSTQTVSQSFSIMGFIITLKLFEGIYRSSIIGLQKHVLLNYISIVVATLRGPGAVIILMYLSRSIQAFFLWNAFVSVVSVIIHYIFTYRSLPSVDRGAQFEIIELKSIKNFATGIIGITIVTLILTQIDKILLSKLLSLSDFGLYSLLSLVAGTLATLIGPITTTFYSRFSELFASGQKNELIDSFHKAAQTVSVILGPIAFVMILFSEVILKLWLPNMQFAISDFYLFKMMVAANLLVGLWYIPHQMQLASGWTRLTINVNLIAIVFVLPMMYLLVPKFGSVSAVYIYIILYIFYLTLVAEYFFSKLLIHEKWNWYKEDIMYPLLASFLGAGLVKFLAPDTESKITSLIILFFGFSVSVVFSVLSAKRILLTLRRIISKIDYTILKKCCL